jgi:hypothetical protein
MDTPQKNLMALVTEATATGLAGAPSFSPTNRRRNRVLSIASSVSPALKVACELSQFAASLN